MLRDVHGQGVSTRKAAAHASKPFESGSPAEGSSSSAGSPVSRAMLRSNSTQECSVQCINTQDIPEEAGTHPGLRHDQRVTCLSGARFREVLMKAVHDKEGPQSGFPRSTCCVHRHYSKPAAVPTDDDV